MSETHFEQFYLGRVYDPEREIITADPIHYDPRHLTTHGVILGMTGSGKTGLGVILLEEALLQGIPTFILDPKGDIVNLLLTFPELRPEDFAPWVDLDGARRYEGGVAAYAAKTAQKWQAGLAEWGVTGERIARLRESAQFTIFTPGSKAGHPVNVLHFFDTPQLDWDEHEEALRERIGGIASALLGLVGIAADPLQSPEHILLARIIEHVWRAGETLDLPKLLRLLQDPPFKQVGVFEMETFFPEKERFALVRQLNNLIAAPGFETWQEGAPLDVGSLRYAPEDGGDQRPRANIFYLAHLNDAQRLFFITLFLEAMRDWLRAQSGAADLRVLLYFDEVFGYFPPYPANPPTKKPLLSLIKQGRSAGLGVVLATQNPADLDYKGLTNAGTWAIGSLRAERDKARVLEGLEGALAETGDAMDRRSVDRALGALKPRVFLFHDIHEGPPVFFHTRWAMSYLRGPLTRKQVRQLTEGQETPAMPEIPQRPETSMAHPKPEAPVRVAPAKAPLDGLSAAPPTLPPDIPQAFLAPTTAFEWALRQHEEEIGRSVLTRAHHLIYVPRLLGLGVVRTLDRKRDVDHQQTIARLIQLQDDGNNGPDGVDWEAEQVAITSNDLSNKSPDRGHYAPPSPTLARARELKRLEKDFSDYLYYNVSTVILHNPALDLYGRVGENRRDFRVRCEVKAREARDAEIKKARARMDAKMAQVQKKLRREQRELTADREELDARKREELLSGVESAFNLLTRRRSSSIISRATRKRTWTKKAEAEVQESIEAIEDFEQQLADLETAWEEETAEINERWADTLTSIEEFKITPRRVDVRVEFCGLAWTPVWRATLADGQTVDLPAREIGGLLSL